MNLPIKKSWCIMVNAYVFCPEIISMPNNCFCEEVVMMMLKYEDVALKDNINFFSIK